MKKIGELVLEEQWLSQKELLKFLKIQATRREEGTPQAESKLGQILKEFGIIDETVLQNLLKKQGVSSKKNATQIDSLQEYPWLSQNNIKKTRYEILKELGQGGMGVVQLVKDNLLGREVARKSININRLKLRKLSKHQKLLLWRLNQEASITAVLEHPNIIPLYEMQQKENGELQFTMRKVQGETLRSLLKKERKKKQKDYDETKFLSIFFKICNAVSYAHSQGVIHRDLKPENIMVGEFGEVYVLDWGIAKKLGKNENFLQEKTEKFFGIQNNQGTQFKTTGGLGTPGYIAPEQAQKASFVGVQADVYALGKILRECYTFKSPTEELSELIEKHTKQISTKKQQETSWINAIEAQIPKDIQAIIKKATEEEIDKRYQTVKEFIADLEKYQKNMQVSVREYSLAEILNKWIKRNKQKVVTSLIIFGLLVIFGLYSFWAKNVEKKNRYFSAMGQVEEEQEKSEKIQIISKQDHAMKMGFLLNALHYLNVALSFQLNLDSTLSKKSEVSQKIMQLCFESQDYQLAFYMAQELDALKLPKRELSKTFVQEVELERTKVAREHKKQFKEGIETLREAEDRWTRERISLQISKFSEEEIFHELLELVEKGTTYFLSDEKKEVKKKEFYGGLVNILRGMQNPKSIKPLLKMIEQLEAKLKDLPENSRPDDSVNYMVSLVEVLGLLDAPNIIPLLYKIRLSMNENGPFWIKTESAYKHLLHFQMLKDGPLRNEEEYLYRGNIKRQKDDFKGAIEDFTQAISLKPKDAKAYNARGLAKKQKGDFKGAIEDYNKAIKLNPKYFGAYNNRGLAKVEKGDFKGAIKDFNKGILLHPKYAKAYGNRGFAKAEKGNFKGAIEDFNEAIRLNTKYAIAYNNRGFAKKKQGDLDGAIEDFNKAIQINPKDADAYNNRGLAKVEKGNFKGAIEDYNEVIRLNPKNANVYNNRGAVKTKKGNFKGAIEDYNEVIRLNPKKASVYCNRGIAKEKQEDLDGAIEDYNEAIRLDPKSTNAYNGRGSVKKKKGDFKGAIEDYDEAIRLNPKSADAYYNRGLVKATKDDLDDAIEDYNEAIRLNPKNAFAYKSRGNAKAEKGNFKGAIEDYNEAIRLNPKDAVAYNDRGNIKAETGNFKGAIEDYDEAIRLNPKYADAYNNRGLVKEKKEDLDGAIEDYNEAIRLDPKSTNAYNGRGTVKKKKGDFKGAIEDYDEAIRLNPKNADAYYNRGLVKATKDDLDDAIEDYNEAIRLNPKNAFAYKSRGNAKAEKGNFKGAIEDYNEAIRLNPKDAVSYYNRGYSEGSKGNFKAAIKDYNEAIRLNPQYTNAYYNRGISKKKQGDLDGAIEDFEKGIEIKPLPQTLKELETFLMTRLVQRYRKKQFQLAREDLIRLKKYVPATPSKQKQFAQMQQRIEKAIEKQKQKQKK